ncbi:ATP-binding cassette domain-containing protein [Amycolatopsis ultiminotia]|uniref:ATP-binding cassette domain-containing protein n=1 Tax=Amycolatopsis ultiminotia TaxID=543629 RepID=UPI003CD0BC4C
MRRNHTPGRLQGLRGGGKGRLTHHGLPERIAAYERKCGAVPLNRSVSGTWSLPTLSGGERRRVLIARAFAPRPRIVVSNEPTNHLDLCQQLETLAVVRSSGLIVPRSEPGRRHVRDGPRSRPRPSRRQRHARAAARAWAACRRVRCACAW